MVLVQNWSFLHVFILDEIGQENVFYDILQGKKAFLVHGFGPKLVIFACFYFRHFRPGKCVSRYCRRKKRLSRL